MGNIIATGQLGSSAATLQTGGGPVTIHLHNTHTSGLTAALTLQRGSNTAVVLYSRTLDAAGAAVIRGINLGPDDVLKGSAGTASKVDYFIATCNDDTDFDVKTFGSSGALKTTRAEVSRTFQIGTRGKVGGTSGWTVGAANDLPYLGTVAASQTGATLVLPIDGLVIGETITGFRIVAQVESAGNAVTIDGILRATTNVAGEPTDAAIGTGMTQVSVTADTAVSQEKTGLSEVVTSGKTYYLLITVTTLGSTDVILQACEITTSAVG